MAMGSPAHSRNPDGNMRTVPPPCRLKRTDDGLPAGGHRSRTTYHVFEASVTREMAEGHVVADYLRFFEGRVWPFLKQSIAMGKMTLADSRRRRTVFEGCGAMEAIGG